ncbi:MAG: DUF2892 domain-containing protein [Gemmataceae bacterium]|nr:DUF2892 domain-containing protein [Gemmataceae bacterium]
MQQSTMSIPRTRTGVRNLDALREPVLPWSGSPVQPPAQAPNVGKSEQSMSLVGGALLAGLGMARGSILMTLAGGALAYRGVSGHCQLYSMLGINTAGPAKMNQETVYRGG